MLFLWPYNKIPLWWYKVYNISSLLEVEEQAAWFVFCPLSFVSDGFLLPLDLVHFSSYSECKSVTDWHFPIFVMELFTVANVLQVTRSMTSYNFWHVTFLCSLNLKYLFNSPVISPLNHWLPCCVLVNFHIFLSFLSVHLLLISVLILFWL